MRFYNGDPLPELVKAPEVTAALIQIDNTPTLGPDVANLIRARIRELEAQVERLEAELKQAKYELRSAELRNAIDFATPGR